MATVKKVRERKAKHKHVWVDDYCDCHFCIAAHQACICGELNTPPRLSVLRLQNMPNARIAWIAALSIVLSFIFAVSGAHSGHEVAGFAASALIGAVALLAIFVLTLDL